LVASVSGQNSSSFAYIDPSSVDPITRTDWCRGQQNTCGFLCAPGGTTPDGNTCDNTALTYNCTCAANNSSPGLKYYTTSLVSYECEENFNRCITANVGVQAAQAKCTSDEMANCGHLDATKFVPPSASESSSSASTSPTGTAGSGGASGTGTTAASTSSSSGAAATMLALGGEYGTGIVAAGVAAAFGLML